MRPPHLIHRLGVVELDVQVLIDALKGAADLDFVLEFDGDFLLDERFEETVGEVRNSELFKARGRADGPEEEHFVGYARAKYEEVVVKGESGGD
jgi:hypothetical protein